MVNVRIGEEAIIDPAEAAMVTEEAAPILFDTMSTWKNARVDVRTGSITESYANTLFCCGRSIKNNWRKMAKPWKMMLTSKRGRVLLLASTSLTFLLKNSLKLQMISKQIESNYRANRVTSLTSISIHRSRFLK